MPLAAVPLLRPVLAITAAAATVLASAVPAAVADARDLTAVCPDPPPAAYDDRHRIADPHRPAVDCLTDLAVVEGYGADDGQRYRPGAEVPRGQMATFVVRMLTAAGVELPAAEDAGYEDVHDGDAHADAIRRLSAAGLVRGVTSDRYEPERPVTRAQMATYLVRAAAYQAGVEETDLQGGDAPFVDVHPDSPHAPSIAGVYELGIAEGISEDRYAPRSSVRRDEMASFVARTLDAMTVRRTVADRDGGALAHTVFTYLAGDLERCFDVTAGSAWVTHCTPETDAALQVRDIPVDDAFGIVAGLVTADVTSVVVEHDDGTAELDLTATRSPALRAWASPVLRSDVRAVVAYDGEREIDRHSFGQGSGDPVSVTDVRIASHEGFDRVVFDLAGEGLPGWHVRYVDPARQQGSGHTIELEGEAVLELTLDNVQYPPPAARSDLTGDRFEGADVLREVYVSNVYEARSQLFAGVSTRTAFEVTALEDPPRLVLDVEHPPAG